MTFARAVSVGLLAMLCGCGDLEGRLLGTASQPITAACVQGVWVTEETPCACTPPDFGFRRTECNEASCREATAYVFVAGGTFHEAVIQRGASTFSAVGTAAAVTAGAWSVQGGTRLVQSTTLPGGRPGRTWDTAASCSATELTRSGSMTVEYHRPGAGLASALTTAAEAGLWTNRPYTP